MKYAALYIVVLMIGGCAKPPQIKVVRIDSELQEYATRFEQASSVYANHPIVIDNLVMVFDDALTKSGEIGFCEQNPDQPLVHISRAYWNLVSDRDREELVFHELGHCVLWLQHDNASVIDAINPSQQVPASIMKVYHFDGGFYYQNRVEYLKQLFNKDYVPTINY